MEAKGEISWHPHFDNYMASDRWAASDDDDDDNWQSLKMWQV